MPTMCVAAVAACRTYRRAGAAARRGHQPRRPVLQRRGRARLHEVHEPDPRDRSGQALRARAARRRARFAAQRRRSPSPDVRSRSVDAQPLHARRHDRQQLVRHAFAARRQDGRQRRRADDPALRRHATDGRRRRATAELDAIVARGRPPRRDLRGAARACAIATRDQIRARFPRIPRRVSGYNLDELLPENGFNVARALVGSEGTCAIVLEAKLTLIQSPQHRVARRTRISATRSRPPITFRRFWSSSRSASKGSKARIVDGLRKKGAPNLDLMPEGRGYLLVEFGFDDAERGATDGASGSSSG